MIKRRLIYQIAGYDPVDPARQYRRFVRGLATFTSTWNVTSQASAFAEARPGVPAHWTVTTGGPNWRVETTYVPLSWSDIVQADFAGAMLRRLGRFWLAVFNFFGTGTVTRYFRASWRYGLFFLFPAYFLLLFADAALLLGFLVAYFAGLENPAFWIVLLSIAVVMFGVLLQWPGRRWLILQALDDWIFAWDHLHGRRPDFEARLDRFADEVTAAVRAGQYDEIVVVGHSLGATFAVNVVARALEREPNLGKLGASVCLLTVGSTIPKFTLHPKAERIRRDVERVASEGAIEWAEYHARADPISFYKFDAASGRIEHNRLDRKPRIRLVSIRGMMGKENYKKTWWRFMRVHHQFVMANPMRYTYDFYMMGCGPIPFLRAVMTHDGPAALIGGNGEFVDAAAPPAQSPLAGARGPAS